MRRRPEQGIREDVAAAAARPGAEEPASAAPVTTVYSPGHPLDVLGTLRPLFRGRADPTFRVDRATGDVWRTCRNEQGGATVVVRPVREGARILAWGAGAARAIELAPELLGRGDDWSGLDLAELPFLQEVRRQNPGLRLLRTNAVFDAIAPAIIEQKITGLEAHRAWHALHLEFGEPAPGPVGLVPGGMRLPLAPHAWRHIPSWAWHRAGVDRARSTALIRAAGVADALERTLPLGRASEEVTRRLRTIPGVGVWTAAETTQRSHGDPDAPSFGDYHLAAGVGWALTGGPVDDERMRELLEPWRGHRQRIVRLLALSGRGKPRHGPRMTVQDHRAI